MKEFLARHNVPFVPYSLYSPYLASSAVFLFPKLGRTVNGKGSVKITYDMQQVECPPPYRVSEMLQQMTSLELLSVEGNWFKGGRVLLF
jgi:hypothetical protein